MDKLETCNQLGTQSSPYLLQHADNPVHWYPWGEEALGLAQQLDKPILLSVGYSACHWCHVMAHESFEDPQTAAVMNELFVNIKVDREERPDLDRIYQLSHQMLSGRPGGWPLTVVLMPQGQIPFFTGTYFPREPRHNMPAFADVLRQVESFFRQNQEKLQQQNQQMLELLQQAVKTQNVAPQTLNASVLDESVKQLMQNYDPEPGGFGKAPKFPHPSSLERLMRHWNATRSHGKNKSEVFEACYHSLRKMAQGGLLDQLGGGFFRYSVDEQWLIPHFEKMLYDNGLLLALYAQAWALKPEPLFETVVQMSARWAIDEMQSEQGGYFSSQDADSEGEEGKYYTWDLEQLKALLDPDELRVAQIHFGLDGEANFESRWHLYQKTPIPALAAATGMDPEACQLVLDRAVHKLLRARRQRQAPGLDHKVLTAWNGLMIKGMACAGRLLNKPEYIDSAQKALDFVYGNLWDGRRLWACYTKGQVHLKAYLDDYVFLMDALLESLQARWRDADLQFLLHLSDVLLSHFEDQDSGGFFFTADDHEALIQRPKTYSDEAVPAGNGIAAQVLLRLGRISGIPRYEEAAQKLLLSAWETIQRYPSVHNAVLAALEEYLFGIETVIIRGRDEQQMSAWHARVPFGPRRMVLAIPDHSKDLPPGLSAYSGNSDVQAYICKAGECQPPISDLDSFAAYFS